MDIVEAVDGKYYADPVLYTDGLDAFFQMDSGEAIVYVRRFAKTSPKSSKSRANAARKSMHMLTKIVEFREMTRVTVPPDFDTMYDVDAWVMTLLAPIPVPRHHRGVFESPGDQLRFVWNLEFDANVIQDALGSGPLDERLMLFASGYPGNVSRSGIQEWLRARLAGEPVTPRIRLSRCVK